MIYALATKSVPLWLYITLSIAAGITLAILLMGRDQKRASIYVSMITLALILWNFHAIATHYNMIAFYDSYQELVHLKLILSEGHLKIGAYYPELGVGPGHSVYYPLLSLLASSFAMATGLDPLRVGVLLPFAPATLMLLSTFLIAKRLLANSKAKELALPLALLAFAVSPDMIYSSTHFYHRELSLALCFLLLYFSIKYLLNELRVGHLFILILLISILPLSHSAYPSVYTVFFTTLTALCLLYRFLPARLKGDEGKIKPTLIPALLLFAAGFLWNFTVNYPSPISYNLKGYINNILHPKFEVGDVARFQAQAAPVMPDVVRPWPWTILLHARDILIIAPLAIMGIAFAYKLAIGRLKDRVELVAMITMASFIPMISSDYIAGWYPLFFRYYAFPLVAFSFGLLYGLLAKLKPMRYGVSMLIVFLVSMAFLSPFWHVYYPRQLYDPSVEWKEVGFPNPYYVSFGDFAKSHEFNCKFTLSDFKELLATTLPVGDLERVRGLDHYGEPNTCIVEFISLRPNLGYNSPEAVKIREAIRMRIDYDYCKVVDASLYSVYWKP
jgi:hypothetical protein